VLSLKTNQKWLTILEKLITVIICVASRNCEKFTETLYFRNSRSFKGIRVDTPKSSSPVLVMISSISVPICNSSACGLLSRWANSGKIRTFRGTFDWREPPHSGAQNFVTKNLEFLLQFMSKILWSCRLMPKLWLRCIKHSAVVHKNWIFFQIYLL